MKMPGTAWLSLKVKERENGGSSLQLTAMYYPKGVLGYLYWFLLYPVHMILFPGMTKAIAQSAFENFIHKNESSSRKFLLVK